MPRINLAGEVRTNAEASRVNSSLPIAQYDSEPGRMDLGLRHRDEQPTVWESVSYPHESEFTFDAFYLRYERQAEARAIIDKPVNDTWQDNPIIHDEAHHEQEEPVSAFEEKCAEFFEGEHTRRKPIHRLNVVDKLGRLGHYSLLVIGTSDGRNLSTRLYEDEFDGLDDLHYLATFGEDRIVSMEIDRNMNSERFRLPEYFEVITQELDDDPESNLKSGSSDGNYDTEMIHHSRCIHVPEGALENDLEGTPALKPVFHELLNIDKIKAASGEGFWRAGYQGLLIQPPEDPNTGTRMQFSDNAEGVENEISEFLNNFQRTIATRAEVTSLDSNIGNPTPHLEANYEAIAAALDLPKSILTGEDRADTASAEDVRQWHQKIGQRRNTFAGPVILEPLIQKLVEYGILPEPHGDGFEVEWQPLDELTEMELAQLQSQRASTLTSLAPGGDVSQIASIGELRHVIGWGPDVGSELDEESKQMDSDSRMRTEEGLEVDEDQLSDDGGPQVEIDMDDGAPTDEDENEAEDEEADALRDALDDAAAEQEQEQEQDEDEDDLF